MNTKKFFVAFVLVLLVGNTFSQQRANVASEGLQRLQWVRQRLTGRVEQQRDEQQLAEGARRCDPRYIIQSVEDELKNVWSEPNEDFKTLSTRALKDDPQALYALSLVCKSKDLEYARWHKYLARAAELGYAKAQLRMALDIAKRRNVSIDDLEKASVFCRNAINDGFACATNLVPIIDKLIEKTEIANKEAEIAKREEACKREEREQMERELQLAELRQRGRTRPFVPYGVSEKIKYDDAVERAKNKDPKALYWLSYYFAKGECVDRNAESAFKFLEKAADANDPVACYTLGLLLENYALQLENYAIQYEDERSAEDRETKNGFCNMCFCIPQPLRHRVSQDENKCLTNKVAVAHVESLYQKAFDGGFSYATNDIARLRRKVAECERRIVQKEAEQKARIENAERAKSLIRDSQEQTKEEERKQERDERKRQREYWSTWPRELSNEENRDLLYETEKRFNSVILGYGYLGGTTNTWKVGCGRNLIVADEGFVRKFDQEGRIVWFGRSRYGDDIEEIRWYHEERDRILQSLREKWAEKRGMSLEEAKRKYDEQNGLGGLLNTLRGRRAMRECKAETPEEKAQRDAEREEQRKQLQSIREKLRKAREEAAKQKEEAREKE